MSDLNSKLFSRDDGRPYYQHDDRGDDRIVKFKGSNGGRRKKRDGNQHNYKRQDMRERLDDDDVHMAADGETSRKSRYVPYGMPRWGGGGGGGSGYRQRNKRWDNSKNPNSGPFHKGGKYPFYRIVMPNVVNVDKSFILKSITQLSEVPFVPYHYQNQGNFTIFFVESFDAARAIERLSGKITLPNGFMLKLKWYGSPPPEITLDAEVLEKVKTVMSQRFDSAKNSLDLSSFASDSSLKAQGVYAALSRHNVLTNVLKIIEENIPNLQSLDLSDNKLTSENLKLIAGKLKSIKGIKLGNNTFRNINELDPLKVCPLEELIVNRNPFRDMFRDQATYVSAIRRKFPKLVRLDDQELPPSYGFDLESETLLPPSQGNFFVNDTARGIVPQFLEQYFGIYDSDDRQGLLQAYHDQAVFSMSAVPFLKGGASAGNNNSANQFNNYTHESRNLMKINNTRRQKLLHQGKLSIVSYLCQLPKTQHDPMSFSIDVPFLSPSLLTFSCNGVFKEVNSKPGTAIRSFSRVFILVPQGTGYCIINEMLFITNATSDQAKVAFKAPAPTPSPSPVPPAALVVGAIPSVDQPLVLSAEQQQQMVLMFSQRSGMNTTWSTKCLQENNWDFEKSACVFQEFNKMGKIPAEAFAPI